MKKLFIYSFASILLNSSISLACDLCAIHNALKTEKDQAGAIDLSIAEQYTNYSRLQNEGGKIENDGGQRLDSYITQVSAAYGICDKFGLRLTVPFIFRDYKRIESGEMEKGDENGLGDITLTARYTIFQKEEAEQTIILKTYLGVKLPTGDSSRLKEEAAEGHSHGDEVVVDEDAHHGEEASHEEEGHAHGDEAAKYLDPRFYHNGVVHEAEIPSGVHGHDLALGSGSVDTLFGLSGFYQYQSFFSLFDMQFSLRQEGDHDYRYGHDFLWSAGSGMYLLTNHELTIGLLANLSGENKQKDVYAGNKADDTAISSVYLGPELVAKINGNLHTFVGVDLPLVQDNSDVQEVGAYRVRLGVGTRF